MGKMTCEAAWELGCLLGASWVPPASLLGASLEIAELPVSPSSVMCPGWRQRDSTRDFNFLDVL